MIVRISLLALGIALSGVADGLAAPWTKASARKADGDAQAKFALKEENGPWMILAATFTGEGAPQQARDLVQELRTKYKLSAYTYQGVFDFSKSIHGRGVDRYGGPQNMRYVNDEVLVEIAVMVGDYPTVTDADGQKVLKRLKYMHPAALEKGEKQNSQTLAAIRNIQKTFMPADSPQKQKGPMGSAFLTTNPLLPKEYFAPKGLEKFVVDLNKDFKYSLLTCPGRYTVRVATFTGQVVLNQQAIKQIESGAEMKSRLDEAADKAHQLTKTLRGKGVQAYEFHDRYQSIVTIGSFGSVGNRGADGKIELDPQIAAIMKQYGAETKMGPGQSPKVGKPKTEGTVPFDVSPLPVEVPKRSISSDYARTADGR